MGRTRGIGDLKTDGMAEDVLEDGCKGTACCQSDAFVFAARFER